MLRKSSFLLVHRLLLFNFLQYENCAQTYMRLNCFKITSISHYFLARRFSTSHDCVLRHKLVPGSPVLLAALGVEMLGGRQGTNDHRWHQGSHCWPQGRPARQTGSSCSVCHRHSAHAQLLRCRILCVRGTQLCQCGKFFYWIASLSIN